MFKLFISDAVPRPVTSRASFPVIAAQMALLGVVLPIPISPVPTMSGARQFRLHDPDAGLYTILACCTVMADLESCRQSNAPPCSTRPSFCSVRLDTDVHHHYPRADKRDSTFIPAPPAEIVNHLAGHFLRIKADAGGNRSWSPAMVMTALCSIFGSCLPVMPAIFMDNSLEPSRAAQALSKVSWRNLACIVLPMDRFSRWFVREYVDSFLVRRVRALPGASLLITSAFMPQDTMS